MIYARRSHRIPKGAAGLFSGCFGLSAQVDVPFYVAKRAVSHRETARFGFRYGLFCKAERRKLFSRGAKHAPDSSPVGLRRGRRASYLCTFGAAPPAPRRGVSPCRSLQPSLLSSGRSRWLRPGLQCRGAYGSASGCAGWPARLCAPPPRRGGAGARLWRASLAAR